MSPKRSKYTDWQRQMVRDAYPVAASYQAKREMMRDVLRLGTWFQELQEQAPPGIAYTVLSLQPTEDQELYEIGSVETCTLSDTTTRPISSYNTIPLDYTYSTLERAVDLLHVLRARDEYLDPPVYPIIAQVEIEHDDAWIQTVLIPDNLAPDTQAWIIEALDDHNIPLQHIDSSLLQAREPELPEVTEQELDAYMTSLTTVYDLASRIQPHKP